MINNYFWRNFSEADIKMTEDEKNRLLKDVQESLDKMPKWIDPLIVNCKSEEVDGHEY